MSTLKNKIVSYFRDRGIDIIRFRDYHREKKQYQHDLNRFSELLNSSQDFAISKEKPMLFERNTESGTASGHYFIQDWYVAKQILKNNPLKHVDIASRVDGFVSHVAVFRELEVFDIRSLESAIPQIKFVQADMMQLSDNLIEYTDSLSCLHAIEHFGLGRYGDPLDPNGHIKAIDNIHKILKQDGRFYFSVPIGKQRIEFNAHRIFSPAYLLNVLADKFKLVKFSYIDDNGHFFEDYKLTDNDLRNDLNCMHGCGIFEFIRI